MAAELDIEDEDFYKNLLLAAGKDTQSVDPELNPTDGKYILPQPGFVIKTKNDKNEKVFVNILCCSDELPAPKDISEEELTKLLDDPDAVNFKIPMALGDPHAEVDKSGKGCIVYDVVINSNFFSKIQKSNFFMGFFMTVVYEGLEDKFNTTLSRDWTRLKNRKSIGQIMQQKIRNKSKPVIREMDNSNAIGLNEVSTKHLSSGKRDDSSIAEPLYKIILEPPEGQVDYLVIEVALPQVKSMKNTSLDVGSDQLILDVQPNKYNLDLKLPHIVDYKSGGAQFNRKTKILTITIPVLHTV